MTWKTTTSCSNCGSSYELDVWDLGHKDSDSIICECCGEVIKKWKNEARSYHISRTISRGSLHPKHEDWEKYKDKKLRFIKGEVEFTGTLKGLDSSSVVAVDANFVVHPWLIQTEKENILLCPEDGWIVCIGKHI